MTQDMLGDRQTSQLSLSNECISAVLIWFPLSHVGLHSWSQQPIFVDNDSVCYTFSLLQRWYQTSFRKIRMIYSSNIWSKINEQKMKYHPCTDTYSRSTKSKNKKHKASVFTFLFSFICNIQCNPCTWVHNGSILIYPGRNKNNKIGDIFFCWWLYLTSVTQSRLNNYFITILMFTSHSNSLQ